MTKVFDNSGVTANSKQLEVLKKHFPQCFDKHGALMSEKLQDLVIDEGSELSKESYGLNWLGKSYARLLANENPRTLLSEDKEHNAKDGNQHSENLLIKGDNLEVLKHLVNAYSEQVKMIYIDPPYNTGSDGFVYQDDRKFTPQQLSQLAGIDNDEAKRILDFTQSNANSHSAWLTFMYPRLYVARELLKDDGVIFISIDDNEVAQLKMLCDEVFGEQNFISTVIWEKRYSPQNAVKWFSEAHDFILVYAKNKLSWTPNLLERSDAMNARYKNYDNDPRGVWKPADATAQGGHGTQSQFYVVTSPNGKKHNLPNGRCWVYTEPVFQKMVADKRIWFGKDGNNVPTIKRFLTEVKQGTACQTIWKYDDVGHNQEGKKEVNSLFPESAVFETPKPIRLLKRILHLSTKNNSTILDFFAGSGTTAHAVMQLNAEDGGNRRCISVQIDEPTDKKSEAYKAGYKTIFEITQARIERAAAKIKNDNPDYKGDLGFKIFETKPLPEDYLEDIPTLTGEQQALPILSDNVDDILATWKVYDGIALTQSLEEVDLAGYAAYQHEKVCYLMHKGFSSDALVAFLQTLDDTENTFEVEKLVVNGADFDSKHQREISEAITQYRNKKDKHISVEFRY